MIGETVVIVRAGAPTGVDRYNNPVPGADVRTDVLHCAVAPATSTEPLEVGRAAVITGQAVYMPPGVDVRPSDRVEIRGVAWQVDGDPAVWVDPFNGRAKGVVVLVKRKDG